MDQLRYSAGDEKGIKYSAERREDDLIKATVEAPEGNREELLATWESTNKWIDREITNIITGGRYETK